MFELEEDKYVEVTAEIGEKIDVNCENETSIYIGRTGLAFNLGVECSSKVINSSEA